MTAICGGGASSLRPGVQELLVFNAGALGSLIGNSGTPWALAAVGALGVITVDAPTFCASDPPAVPLITQQSWDDLLHLGDFPNHLDAVSLFTDLVLNAIWYAACQCNSVATPPQPIVPAPTDQPGFGTAGTLPCFSNTIQHTAIYDPTSSDVTGIQGVLGPPGAIVNQVRGSVTQHCTTLPSPLPTTAHFTMHTPSSPSSAEASTVDIMFYTAANAQVGTTQVGPGFLPNTNYELTVVIPATAHHWFISHENTFFNPPTAIDTLTLDLICPGGGSGGLSTPCVTDPTAMSLMEQILEYVKLIQRQAVPFAYTVKATHSGLSGNGELTVQGLIGVRIVVTGTIAGTIGVESGDPEQAFGLGWFNWGSSDGWQPRQFLGTTSNTSFPNAAGQYTRLGYSLAPGVVATISELVREA